MIDAAHRGMTAGEGRRGTTVAGIQITDLQTTEGATTAAEVIGGGAQNHHFHVHVAAQGALQRRKRKESEYNSYEMSLFCLKKLTCFAEFRLGKAPRQMFLVAIRKLKRGEKRDRKKKQPLRLHHL